MKTLMILRHAKSSWKDDTIADHDRPLNERGKNDAPRMGQVIYQEDLTPDLIISSSAKRAVKTAALAAEACHYEGEILKNSDLYAAAPEAYLDVLSGLDEGFQRVMVVGHNPGLEELLLDLTGEAEALPTAALAVVSLKIDTWAELAGRLEGADEELGDLVHLYRPKEMD